MRDIDYFYALMTPEQRAFEFVEITNRHEAFHMAHSPYKSQYSEDMRFLLDMIADLIKDLP